MTQNPSSAIPDKPVRARRLVWLMVAGLLLISAGLAYRHFWYGRPMGEGPAGPTVAREPFASVWSQRRVLLLGIGDSVTAGYGAPPKHGYFDRLANNPDDEFAEMRGICLAHVLPNFTATNLALSGSTSLECLEILVPKVETQSEETFGIVVMTTGGNDVIHHYGRTPPREGAMYGATLEQARPWIDNFEVRMNAILDQLGMKFPGGCLFFVANIYDPTDGVGDAFNAGLPSWPEGLAVLGAYNEVLTRVARERENVHLVDMHGTFLGHGIHCLQFWHKHYQAEDPHYWYWDNLEDPNDRGYDALRRAFLNVMVQVVPAALSETRSTKPLSKEQPAPDDQHGDDQHGDDQRGESEKQDR